ncbi:DNA mismatch repair endonuclease MutL [Mobilitalea sibirica]|uniref:DNA mismatch repair protein MutL n=1 Tax=Mobilitalea sibirica TaxID=1462919 RepID=A0A8J7KZS5_9FIRM|nr:DNA mismatch repair endonuclease MutL [Mobilitalea sibirica]MBH1940863.1 DNA mismatch repair endonuclease MutL [Mobilitalea sibirica]
MPFIHVLDEPTINQIAAGEVVERPSAVVKELVENAVDAGSTAITVEIKEGGLSLIRITDNGAGIAKEDIPMAFLRHATSKIRTAQDLLSVTSLGFRGEALSSIAAVSQVELITKTSSSLNGYRYIIEGGDEKSLEEIGSPGGTTILIRNLFYNTPARRKFLKSAVTEAGYISDLMERLMVSHPDISFKYIVNNQVKLQSSGNNNIKDILYNIYGRDITKEILPLHYESNELKITGFIGKPMINRGNRMYENYFINGRYIKSNVITKAIEEAYKPFLMQHKYPFTSLYYEIDPNTIDVNVHPQKLEIRLKNNETVYQATVDAIRDILSGKEMIPKVTLTKEETNEEQATKLPEPFEEIRRKLVLEPMHNKKSPQNFDSHGVNANFNGNSFKNTSFDKSSVGYHNSSYNAVPTSGDEAHNSSSDQSLLDHSPTESVVKEDIAYGETKQLNLFTEDNPTKEEKFLSKTSFEEHKIIGQVFSTYWLVEYKKELYIIDQHAAHEKVLYEKIMAAAKDKIYSSQQLLPPIVLTLTLREQEVLQKHEEFLKQIGYEFEPFGGNEYSVRAVPADLFGLSEKELILEFIDELAESLVNNTPNPSSILERVASLSCKAAVKANHKFSLHEATALIKDLLTLENPYHCPHGRPVIISMSQYELEKKFKRIL